MATTYQKQLLKAPLNQVLSQVQKFGFINVPTETRINIGSGGGLSDRFHYEGTCYSLGVWPWVGYGPLNGAPVDILFNGIKKTEVRTTSDGYFRGNFIGKEVGEGTHTITARMKAFGDAIANYLSSQASSSFVVTGPGTGSDVGIQKPVIWDIGLLVNLGIGATIGLIVGATVFKRGLVGRVVGRARELREEIRGY